MRSIVARIHAYSRHLIPKASDWGEHIYITGFWFVDEPEWTPPDALLRFLEAGDPPVYIGFGSMNFGSGEDRTHMIREVAKDYRLVIAKGWGGLTNDDLPKTVYALDFAPHDWLFPRMAGVIHHGGAGTIAAGLRAGVPQSVISFFGDQPYWGRLIHRPGLGPEHLPRKALTTDHLHMRIKALSEDTLMRQRAQAMGQRISAEDGVGTAVRAVQQCLGGRPLALRADRPGNRDPAGYPPPDDADWRGW